MTAEGDKKFNYAFRQMSQVESLGVLLYLCSFRYAFLLAHTSWHCRAPLASTFKRLQEAYTQSC